MKIDLHETKGDLAITLPDEHFYHETIKRLPKRRWLPAQKLWVVPPWLPILEDIKKWCPNLEWSDAANEIYYKEVAAETKRSEIARGHFTIPDDAFNGVLFKKRPYRHQLTALFLARDLDAFAYLMDQGTGKTKTLIDDAAHNYRNGKIDCVIIVAPNSVKTNWVDPNEDADHPDQFTEHLPDDITAIKAAFFASPRGKQKEALEKFWKAINVKSRALLVYAINVESMSLERVQDDLVRICKARNVFMAIDESTRIGRHTAKRTKVALKLRPFTKVRRIASGTPVIKSPLKAFSQFQFLDPSIMGISTYAEFTSRYAVVRGDHNIVVAYRNLDELKTKIAGASYRVTKDECLDLPPKVYQKRLVSMGVEQSLLYQNMKKEAVAAIQKTERIVDGHVYIEATNVMVQMLRLQQIVAGYLPQINDEGQQIGVIKIDKKGRPPKINEVIDAMESCEDEKVIIWCKFRFEVDEMCQALKEEGISHVKFDGSVNERDRVTARQSFQSDPKVRAFVGQMQAGGIGLNLFAASQAFYLSNPFSTEDRVQSEDRCHRIGSTRSVTYTDLLCPGTVDYRVLDVLRANKNVSDMILGDTYKEWI